MSEKEEMYLQNLEEKLYRGAASKDYLLKVFSILGEYLLLVTPSQYAEVSGVSYNTARSRSFDINGNRFCFISELEEQLQQ